MRVVKHTDQSRMVVYDRSKTESVQVRRAAKHLRGKLSAGQKKVLAAARRGAPGSSAGGQERRAVS